MSRDKKKLVMGSFAAALLIVPIIAHAATGVPQSSVTNVFTPSTEAITQFSNNNNQNTSGRRSAKIRIAQNGDDSNNDVVDIDTSDLFDYVIEDKRTSADEILRTKVIPTWYNTELDAVDYFFDELKVDSIYISDYYMLFHSDNGGHYSVKVVLADDWRENWTYMDYGEFLYNKPYEAGKTTTEPLIKKVTVSHDIYTTYVEGMNYELHFDVLTDTITAEGATEERGFWYMP